MKMSLDCEIVDEDTFLDMEMEKFSDLSAVEGFYWPSKDELLSEKRCSSLPSIETLLPKCNTSKQDQAKSSHGHLSCREYLESVRYDDDSSEALENQVVISQNEGLDMQQSEYYEEIEIEDETPLSENGLLECRWEDCWNLFKSQKTLVSHIESAHVDSQRRCDRFPCLWEACPRSNRPFNARYKLLIHMRVHSGEKPNKCAFPGCYKAFSRLENLKIHQRSHTGERPYLCQYTSCKKAFSNSSDRAKHQRTHFDTRPYACQIKGCLKKYTDPSSLRKHVKNHSGASYPKKLIASEPIVSPAELQSRGTRHNSVSSDTLSNPEQGSSPSWDSNQELSFFDYNDALTDQLDSDIEREFLDAEELEKSSFLSLNEEDIIRTFS